MKTTNCEHINILLIDFIDKKLDQTNTELVKEHLNKCSSCRAELEQYLVLFNDFKQIKDEEPPTSIRSTFLQSIETEKAKQSEAPVIDINANTRKTWLYNPFSQIAAGVAILVTGILLGLVVNRPESNNGQVAQLKTEMDDMRQMLFMSKLDQNSASQRIQAVNYTNEMMAPNPEIIDALVNTMNTDENVNVRMASIHALSKLTASAEVRDALVKSLETQDNALLQITLINILVEVQETNAIGVMEDLMKKEGTIDAVKEMAEKGLTTFI